MVAAIASLDRSVARGPRWSGQALAGGSRQAVVLVPRPRIGASTGCERHTCAALTDASSDEVLTLDLSGHGRLESGTRIVARKPARVELGACCAHSSLTAEATAAAVDEFVAGSIVGESVRDDGGIETAEVGGEILCAVGDVGM